MTAIPKQTKKPEQKILPYTKKITTYDADELELVDVEKKDFDGKLYQAHDFKTKVNCINGSHMIWIPEKILVDMFAVAGLVKEEVSWLGTVDRGVNGFTITEIFLPEQVVSGAETEMTNAGVADIGLELMERAPDASLVNKLRFWCHTHPHGGTSPSGPDITQTKKLLKDVDDFFIRGICNKKGRLEFTLFLIDEGLQISDCPWQPLVEYIHESLNHWLVQVNSFVKKKAPYVYKPTPGFGHQGFNQYGNGAYNRQFGNKVWCYKAGKYVEKDKEIWRVKYQCHLTDEDLETADEIEKKIGKKNGSLNLATFFPKLKAATFLQGLEMSQVLTIYESWMMNPTLYSDVEFLEFVEMYNDDYYNNYSANF